MQRHYSRERRGEVKASECVFGFVGMKKNEERSNRSVECECGGKKKGENCLFLKNIVK